ncbi:MAG TPA: OsmC family protein [Bacteroidales bacterium]|nr:OsmC family protein [Bacteroidales bacterium]
MKSEVNVKWNDKMSFEGDIDGHKIEIDALPESGGEGKGPRPKPFMLLALAGCTGMDVISILRKMRVEPDYFNIKIEAEASEEHPKKYTEITVIYQFKGKDLPQDKLEKAVSLSEEKYCGVSAVYRKAIKMNNRIEIL